MLNLLIKDFRIIFAKEKTLGARIVGALLSVLFIGAFVGIETFLFTAVLTKIKDYKNAPSAFTCLFLVIISVLMIADSIMKAQKLFFNKKDIEQLSTHPIENSMLISSKLIFLFLSHYATTFIFTYPIFISYGSIFNKPIMFYYSTLFYPVLSFFFEVGVALLLVYPVWILFQYLKKHILIEFVIAIAGIFGMSYLYSVVLTAFVDMVANNSITMIFTEDSISSLVSAMGYAVPMNYLIDAFLANKSSSFIPFVCISAVIFVIGATITIMMFQRMRNLSIASRVRVRSASLKVRSQTYALISKEISLITKNHDFIFSFSGLLVVQPFLLYLIIVAMSMIFTSGTFMYYVTLFPNFTSLICVFLVMMVSIIINSGATQYISTEAATIKNLKTIPITPGRQLLIKTAIPYVMSEASLIISLLVILISGVMTPLSTLFAFLLTTVVLFVFDVVSMMEELKIRHGKPRSTFVSSLYSYAMPIGYVVVALILSYLGVELTLIYLSGLAFFVLLGLPTTVRVLRRMGDWFMELETLY